MSEALFRTLSRVSSSCEIQLVLKHTYPKTYIRSASILLQGSQHTPNITIHQGKRYDEVSDFHDMRFSQKMI